ncbi:hypothetical protein FT663_03746 [Candidozyma haemuli var. vulneris]|uniref:TORC1 subunit TCO89 n=1 Tax=Candidozyma haemuli TaxID=45357 RepID=A0A2V1AM86_9ASCO|nr:hypothetical protein CXQ85_000939 [[Candida] haemuloni]KAF3987593.1 hypothetical protein FT662_03899 [[Candida] haemuloni var. vulneris]KAF3989149.1 hypothetical protein FT663_03746 [[Candida] haemuloni var. vulneris]PVH18656.1 hypothetical protein CXQ85_000939 [[Candida] haemuloni]
MTPGELQDDTSSRNTDSTSQRSSDNSESGFNEPSSQPGQDQIKPPRPTSRTPTHEKKPHLRRTHMRSQSHTKMPTRLSTSGPKPNLNRSKSSDIIRTQRQPGIKRNNRSFTKVAGFLPLHKTVSNSSVKAPGTLNRSTSANSLKGFAPLRKTTSNGSSKDKQALHKTFSNSSMRSSKSSNSLKGLNNSVNNGSGIGLRLSSKRGRAIVKLNEDAESNEYEDLSEDSESETHSRPQDQSNENISSDQQDWNEENKISEVPEQSESYSSSEYRKAPESDERQPSQTYEAEKENSQIAKERESAFKEKKDPKSRLSQEQDQAKCTSEPPAYMSTNSSTDELMNNNLYGGSLLLSQSTGLMRKINEPLGYHASGEASDDRLDQTTRDESTSGISFKARPYNELRNKEPAEPVQATTTAASVSSYQPDQSIFSNLQRNNSKYLNNSKSQRPTNQSQGSQSNIRTGKDFSNFLNNSHSSNGAPGHNIETRTQQRLWLQRENSLMDVSSNIDASKLQNLSNMSLNKLMFAHNYNNSTTNVREPSRAAGQQTPGVQGGGQLGEVEGQGAGDASNVTNLLYLIQSGHQQGSVRSRTEYERLNREYLNVRRHLNPVAESLDRLEKYYGGKKGLNVQKNSQAPKGASSSVHSQMMTVNKFEEFAADKEERENKAALLVNRVWQDALFQTSSTTSPSASRQGEPSDQGGSQFHHNPQQIQQQKSQPMKPSRSSSSIQQRSSLTPTTRAVKLATQASGEGSLPQR